MPQHVSTESDNLAQTADDLEAVIEALENVDWSLVDAVSTSDVAKWNEKLQYARMRVIADQ